MKIDGDEYRKDTGFVHKLDEDDIPQVGQISHIYVVNGKTVVFKAQRFNSFYHSHFQCYCLRQVDEEPSFFLYDKLILKKPLHIRKPCILPGHNVIILPYSICY